MKEKIDVLLKEEHIEELVVAIRRDLHVNPELSEEETETMAYICGLLDQWQIPYTNKVADTGIVATIEGSRSGPVVGLRADMDALPICEKTGLSFSSKRENVMHACGHDAHMAILLAVGRVLSLVKEQLPGSVKLFFQPAEETIGGAKRMIAAGCLTEPNVDYVLGLHVEPGLDTGQIGIRYGKMYAASDMVDIQVMGKGAHGAHPEEGVDSILAAANFLNSLQTLVSRKISPLNSAVCSFGKIQGGTARNQIADVTKLEGIIRTLDQDTRLFMRKQLKRLAKGVGEAMGAEIQVHITESYGPLINDNNVVRLVEENAVALLGKEHVIIEDVPDLGCEDFSYFAMERPGCYFHLGCYTRESGERADLHNSAFTIDEACLMIGVRLQLENVISLLKKWNEN